MPIGLGAMRLSTAVDRDDDRAVSVIRAALDAGATLIDTADAYCHDESDVGHNERLVARALEGWSGDRTRITVATKGGLRRPNGAWVADGRAKHLRDACDASRAALGVETIDLYELHAVDPKTPITTSVRALASLRDEGKIRRVGLANVTVGQIEAARQITDIDAVQVSLSPIDSTSLRNGVAEYCRDHSILLIAYRPLGGDAMKRIVRDETIARIAAKHGRSPQNIVLAWLLSFGDGVVPIPGATRMETARSLGDALSLTLDDEDRWQLDASFCGRLLRVPRAARRPRPEATGDVVVIMGMPGAGKSSEARRLEAQGYARLNRDALGGSLSDLVPRLDEALAAGNGRIVLDNTYPTRAARNEIVECAWNRGVPVRCVWMDTSIGDAQINAVLRMIQAHGSLPSPEEIRERGKRDSRYLLPDALFRYERMVEPPMEDEGFARIDRRPFTRDPASDGARGLFLDFDDVVRGGSGKTALLCNDVAIAAHVRDKLGEYAAAGWRVHLHAWRPQVSQGALTMADAAACIDRVRGMLGFDVDVAVCPHPAGPPTCWCRKPLPGTALDFAHRRGVSLGRSLVVGSSAADRTLATRLGATFEDFEAFTAA